MDNSRLSKFQHQYWLTKETVYRKLGKKEEECIVSSDASLDAKLELFKSIQQTSLAMNKLLDRYQERICYLAQEQNSMGRFLKEFGKSDKTNAGKMMIQMGKSLIFASQQEITLRPPLLRLYQEVETFRHRGIEDTHDTIRRMERHRTEYRATLKWMKNISQELDPETFRQMDKFRKVQTEVKKSKAQFDKLKLACLQKVDLLAAARCNMFSHALIHYQTSTMTNNEKITQLFSTLANAFKGYQHFQFSVIKELADLPEHPPPRNGPSASHPPTDLLLDLDKNNGSGDGGVVDESEDELLLDISKENPQRSKDDDYAAQELMRTNERLLENLLGGPLDPSPETEHALEALDLTLAWPSQTEAKDTSAPKGSAKGKVKTAGELLSDEFVSLPFEGEDPDRDSLLNELLGQASCPAGGTLLTQSHQTPLVPSKSWTNETSSFLPSQLLDLGNLNREQGDLLSRNPLVPGGEGPKSSSRKGLVPPCGNSGGVAAWYNSFADLDPLANPDSIGKKDEEKEGIENRYC